MLGILIADALSTLDSPTFSVLNFVSMKKSDLVAIYGTLEAIGEVFAPVNEGEPLTRSAISQWGDEIPPLREYQLRELVPGIEAQIDALRRRGRSRARA